MVRDDHGRFIPPLEQNIAHGDTPFEQSLYASYEDLYDVEKIKYYIMLDLLKGLAKNDGPNTSRYVLLEELKNLHVVYDAARVRRIFHDALLEFDRRWGSPDSNYFIDIELARRAEQIRQCGCFLPQSERYFDELGRLVARLGVYEIVALDEGGMIVAFSNGLNVTIGLDQTFEHRVVRASKTLDKLLSRRDLEDLKSADRTSGGKESGSFDVAEMQDSHSLKQDEMDSYGKVALDLGYEELDINRINLHILPTTYGNGAWNGKASDAEDSPWAWSRAFLDFFMNIRDIAARRTQDQDSLDLTIDYEIIRQTDTGGVNVAGETLLFHHVTSGTEKDDGISFRLFTLPFVSVGSQAAGDYQLNLKISDGEKAAVRKYPFTIADRLYDLLIVDIEGPQYAGIPKCPRIAESRPGKSITVLIPVRDLPYIISDSAYCATVSIYMFRNDEIKRGSVRVSDLYAFTFDDSARVELPSAIDQPVDSSNIRRPVAMIHVCQPAPQAYLTYTFEVPKSLPDGTRVRSGKYTLAAMVTSGSMRIAEAVMTDLQIR